jgi:hypothetical protein
MSLYPIHIEWFSDDSEDLDVEAGTFAEACRKAYDEWSPTGWTHLSVWDLDRSQSMSFDLDRPFDEGKRWINGV